MSDIEETDEVLVYLVTTQPELTGTSGGLIGENSMADVFMADLTENKTTDLLVASATESLAGDVLMSDLSKATSEGLSAARVIETTSVNVADTKIAVVTKEYVPDVTMAGTTQYMSYSNMTAVAGTTQQMSNSIMPAVAGTTQHVSNSNMTAVAGTTQHMSNSNMTAFAGTTQHMSNSNMTAVAGTKRPMLDVTVTNAAGTKKPLLDVSVASLAKTKEHMSDVTVTTVSETNQPMSDLTITCVAETKLFSGVTVATVAETKEPLSDVTVATVAETSETLSDITIATVTEKTELISDVNLTTLVETKEHAISDVVINSTERDMAEDMETTAVDVAETNHMGTVNSSLLDLTETKEALDSMEVGIATTTQDEFTKTADAGKGIATTTWAGAIKFKVMGLSKTKKSSVNKTKLSDFTNSSADSGLVDKHLVIDLTETEDGRGTEDLSEAEDVDIMEVEELVSRVSNVTKNRDASKDEIISDITCIEMDKSSVMADSTCIEKDKLSMMDESASQEEESLMIDETSRHSDELLIIDETTTHSDDLAMMNETRTQEDELIKINVISKKPTKRRDKKALLREKVLPEQLKYIMTFQREFPITVGYVARLLLSGMTPMETGEELRSYIESLNLPASLHPTSFYASIYNFPQRLKTVRYSCVQKWDLFCHKMSEPFPITFLASEDQSTPAVTLAETSDRQISVVDPASASIQSTLTLSPKKGLHSYQIQLRPKLKSREARMKISSSLVQTQPGNGMTLASVDASSPINPSSSSAKEAKAWNDHALPSIQTTSAMNPSSSSAKEAQAWNDHALPSIQTTSAMNPSSSSMQTTPDLNQTSPLKTAPSQKINKHDLNLNELKRYIMSFKCDYPMKNGYVAKLLLIFYSVESVADEIISYVSSLSVPVIIHRELLTEGICQVYSKYKEMGCNLFADWSEFDSFLNLPFSLPVELSSEAGQILQREATIIKLNNEVASLKSRVMNYRSKKEEKKKSMATLINQMQEKIDNKNRKINFWQKKYQRLLDQFNMYKLKNDSLEVNKDNSSQMNKVSSNVGSLKDTRKGPVEGTTCLSTCVCGKDEQKNPGVKLNQEQYELSLRKCIYNCLVHNVLPGKCQDLLKFTAENLFNTQLTKLGNRSEDWTRELSLLSSLQLGHTLHWHCEAMVVEMSAVLFEGRPVSQVKVKMSPLGHTLFIDFLASPEITARECNELVRETFLKAVKEYIHACHLPEATATDVLMNKVKSAILDDAVTKNSASESLNKKMDHDSLKSQSSFDHLKTFETSAKSALIKLDKTWLVSGREQSAGPGKMCLLMKLIRNIQTFRFSSDLGDPVGFEAFLKGLNLPVVDLDVKSQNSRKLLLFQQSTFIHSIKSPLLQFLIRFRKKPLADEIVQTLRNPLIQIQLHCLGLFCRFLVEPWTRERTKTSNNQEVRTTLLQKSMAMLTRVIKEPDLLFTMLVDTFGTPYGQDVFSLQDAQAQGMLFLHNVRKYSECIMQLATAFTQSLQKFLTRPRENMSEEAASAPAIEDGAENVHGIPTEEIGLLGWKSRAIFNKTLDWLLGLDPLVQEQYIRYAIQQTPKMEMDNSRPAESDSTEEAGSLEEDSSPEEEVCAEVGGQGGKARLESLIAEELRTNGDVLALPCFRSLVQSDKDKLRRFLQDDNALSGCLLEHLRAENGQNVTFLELVVCVSNVSESNAAASQVFLYYWKQGEDRSDSVICLPMPKFLTDFAVGYLKFSADGMY